MVDIPSDVTMTASIGTGQIFNGEIEVASDTDWIAVTLQAGQSYQISLSTPGTTGLRDSFVSIFDASGVLVGADDDGGDRLDSQATYTPTQTGTVYIEARSYGAGTGTYSIEVTEVDHPEFLDTINWGTQMSTNVIDVYFAPEGEVVDGRT